MAELNRTPETTPEREAEAQRLAGIIGQRVQEEVLQMARIMVSKPDSQLCDCCHRLKTKAQARE